MLNKIINVDLHVHSYASKYKEGKIKREDGTEFGIVDDSIAENINVILDNLDSNGINLFSFTDHNRFDANLYKVAIENLQNNNRKNLINIVSGVEFDVQIEENKKSCHIITIFDTKSNDDFNKISDEIEKDKLEKKEEYYTLTRFENLMKNIKLNTIFIACQRKSLVNPNGGTNSISNSITDIYEFLKVGFISALEYQKSSVEGMLKENLKDFPKEIGLVCGSDCHQWSVYPKHDEQENNPNKKWYFSVKALPSFLGLLLALSSYNTRFRRTENPNGYIKSFTVGDKEIQLSGGINVIIGENGSGKSTLLSLLSNRKLETYQKRIITNSKIGYLSNGINKIHTVIQNEIIDKNNKNNNNLFEDEKFNLIDNSKFESLVNNYSTQLYESVLNRINYKNTKEKLLASTIVLNPELYYKKTYYISIDLTDFAVNEDLYKNRLQKLNLLLSTLKTEIDEKIYIDSEKEELKKAYNGILKVRTNIVEKYKRLQLKNETINLIIEKTKDYANKITKSSVEDDQKATTYKKGVNKFKEYISKFYKTYILKESPVPMWCDLNDKEGISEKKDNGYRFIRKAKYYLNDNLREEFYKTVFNKNYQSIEKINNISTMEELINAISSANADNYENKYKENVNKFVEENKKSKYEVLEATSSNRMGNTLGEKSLVYYKYLTYEESEYEILFIDQPEDNISNIKIAKELINYLNNLRDKKQVIFVTHNPLLVVNLDVDNVIFLSNTNSIININSGCLEQKGVLNEVAKVLDGGKETIEKRLKFYYGE